VAGREFTEADRIGSERLVMVSQSIAQRLFPNGLAVDRTLSVTSSLSTSGVVDSTPSRIVGVVADVDDESVDGGAAMTIYQVYRTKGLPMRLFLGVPAQWGR